ncbi:MAG: hypothetical protein JST92_22260, partial [Deltaproteobacteria bacterium]|nr:hypothetical protein [Deltaproteobacteria bacterium]
GTVLRPSVVRDLGTDLQAAVGSDGKVKAGFGLEGKSGTGVDSALTGCAAACANAREGARTTVAHAARTLAREERTVAHAARTLAHAARTLAHAARPLARTADPRAPAAARPFTS